MSHDIRDDTTQIQSFLANTFIFFYNVKRNSSKFSRHAEQNFEFIAIEMTSLYFNLQSDINGIKTYFKLTVPIYIFWILITSTHMSIVGNNEIVITLVAAFAIYKLFSFTIVNYFITDQIEYSEYSKYWKSPGKLFVKFVKTFNNEMRLQTAH